MGKYKPYPAYKDSGVEWLGDVPERWKIFPAFRLFRERRVQNNKGEETNVLSLSYGSIVRRNIEDNFGLLPESFNTYQIVGLWNIILRLTDLQNDKRSLRVGQVKEKGIITSAYLCLEAASEIYHSYAYKLLHSYDLVKVFYSMGGGLRQSMKFADLRRMPILCPPFEEQAQIAAFLDHETAKIDRLIEKQEKLIELLKEKRQAVISHAVTKGLDPDVEMKDSGVEWLGEIPAHWEVKRLKQISSSMKAGPFGSSLIKDNYTKTGIKVYGQEQVIADDFSIGDYYISNEKFLEMTQYAVFTGDILISCVGSFGKIAIVPDNAERGITNPRLIKITLVNSIIPVFFKRLLRSKVTFEQMSLMSRGGTMDVINIGILSELILPIPSKAEQIEINNFLNIETTRIDKTVRLAQKQITLLKERRTALISAAVTGKIDVRDWKAEG
ncbi:restriction endonuclease subunit S [Maridesulfovibrio sp.]|uniref:restriction endonuclease subunit S n=1 Tax=Maridesulfovibrio sp. TaxID=2795000 RepID=UPI002AA66F2C|nr:restriction endonuclease subunit S [Maridesulfovibrio sp.]